jgi:hypothetical protein
MASELLKGLLFRIEPVKPASAQEGVFYEHMSDILMYFSDLEHLYRSSEHVYNNLNNAFECLSRHLTISLPMKGIERTSYENQETEVKNIQNVINEKPKQEEEKTASKANDGYDVLDDISIEKQKAIQTQEVREVKYLTWQDIKKNSKKV